MDEADRYERASAGFAAALREVHPQQWTAPTPCAEWDVRALVNHMTRGNLNYVALLAGATAADFIRLRDADALGADPVAAYDASVRDCAHAFRAPGALDRMLDYPLGRARGGQLLAVRTTDSLVHTWDLARAVGAPEALDPGLVAWAAASLEQTYAGLAGLERFFAPAQPSEQPPAGDEQDRLLRRLGRCP
ncbi:TIGR03086 family metal-binding protein [Dactylosporangium sp. McL0621]|uniref:TIGR03086 family metal-binding protein n=1 Tax=Dactylosporangium sp. McL0621 TaxID=3415678 RepID=UPI003CEE02F8